MPPLNPSVAIVILTWNGIHHLQKFLPSVLASTYQNKQIIVADNASTDETVAWLTSAYPLITILRNKENYGFARGYNEALKNVQANYFVLLNSDVEVTPGWLEPVIELMETDEAIAACQPKILSYNNKHMFEYAGAAGGWIDVLGYPFSRGRIFEVCEEDKGQYDSASPIFWASGAALFIRASLFKKAGGFDSYFFAHQEEIDLCWRLQKAGYKIMACPASVVYHVGAGTLPKGGQKLYLNFRNNLIMLAKNVSGGALMWKLPLRIALDAVAAWKGLLTGDTPTFAAIFKAHLAFINWMFKKHQRNSLPRQKKPLLEGSYKGLIVYDHFIKKKKTFAEIVH